MARRNGIGPLAASLAVPLAALAVAACGSDDKSSSDKPAPKAPKTASGGAAAVGVADDDKLGKHLVDSKGDTLYLFKKDSGNKSACSGACAAAWPPILATGQPKVSDGLTASNLGSAARSDGKAQLTYNGHPLYRFGGDQAPGDTNGQGSTEFGGSWFVLSPAGNEISKTGSSAGGSGNGY